MWIYRLKRMSVKMACICLICVFLFFDGIVATAAGVGDSFDSNGRYEEIVLNAQNEKNHYVEKFPKLSEEDAKYFLCFILNTDIYEKKKNEALLKDDLYFKVLTGDFSSFNSAEEVRLYCWGLSMFIRDQMNQQIATANKKIPISSDVLVDILSKRISPEKNRDITDLSDDIIGEQAEYLEDIVKSNVVSMVSDIVWRYTGVDIAAADLLQYVNIGISTVQDIANMPKKIERFVDNITIALHAQVLVFENEFSGRAMYFCSYLDFRQSVSSPDDEIFRTEMELQKALITEHNYPNLILNFLTFLTGKDTWDRHTDMIDIWAEYLYQLEQAIKIDSHSYEITTEAATCTSPGYSIRTCALCGERTVTETDKVLKHTYVVTTSPSTCSIHGRKYYKCSVCQYSYSESLPLNPNAHTYDDDRICTGCGKIALSNNPRIRFSYEPVRYGEDYTTPQNMQITYQGIVLRDGVDYTLESMDNCRGIGVPSYVRFRGIGQFAESQSFEWCMSRGIPSGKVLDRWSENMQIHEYPYGSVQPLQGRPEHFGSDQIIIYNVETNEEVFYREAAPGTYRAKIVFRNSPYYEDGEVITNTWIYVVPYGIPPFFPVIAQGCIGNPVYTFKMNGEAETVGWKWSDEDQYRIISGDSEEYALAIFDGENKNVYTETCAQVLLIADQHRYVYHNGIYECEVCGNCISTVEGISITLDGRIGLNFYMRLDKNVSRIVLCGEEVDISFNKEECIIENGLYKCTCYIPIQNKQKEIAVHIYDINGFEMEMYGATSCTLEDYLKSATQSEDINLSDLAMKLLEYGNRVNAYFNDEELVYEKNYDLDFNEYAPDFSGFTGDNHYLGSSLLLEEGTTVRHYFSQKPMNAMVNGKNVDVHMIDDIYYIEISNIAGNELNKYYVVSTEEGKFSYCALSYCSLETDGTLAAIQEGLLEYYKALAVYCN